MLFPEERANLRREGWSEKGKHGKCRRCTLREEQGLVGRESHEGERCTTCGREMVAWNRWYTKCSRQEQAQMREAGLTPAGKGGLCSGCQQRAKTKNKTNPPA
jgi:hypothetical protein